MNNKFRALLVSVSTVAIFLGTCVLLVALIDKYPMATGLGILVVATALMGRSIYMNELNRLDSDSNSEDAKSKEA
jgi:hypothetical protein